MVGARDATARPDEFRGVESAGVRSWVVVHP